MADIEDEKSYREDRIFDPFRTRRREDWKRRFPIYRCSVPEIVGLLRVTNATKPSVLSNIV